MKLKKANTQKEFILSLDKDLAISENFISQKYLNKKFKGNFLKWQKYALKSLELGSLYIDIDKIPPTK